MNPRRPLTLGGLLLCTVACVAPPTQKIMAGAGQVELRSFQSRTFESTDRDRMLRTVIATLQDLGFIIDQADDTLGVVTGTKLAGYQIRMTVTVRASGETQLLVRSSAYYNTKPIEEPLPYQNFFASLEKALFLTAQQVD